MLSRKRKELTNEDLKELIDSVTEKMLCEQKALSEDDPNSVCAAHHRGAISAYAGVLKEFQQRLYENGYYKVKVDTKQL